MKTKGPLLTDFLPVFLFVLLLVLFWKVIFLKNFFWFYDIKNFFYPGKVFYAKYLRQGIFPLWNPYIGNGTPFLAEGQTGIFYLLNILLYSTLPNPFAFSFSVILHFFLLGLFSYLYARAVDLGRLAAFIAALSFMFGSFFVGHIIHISLINTAVWLPALFLFVECYFKGNNFIYIILAGIVIGFQFLAGFPQMTMYSLLAVGLYFLFKMVADFKKEKDARKTIKLGLSLIVMAIVGVGISAVQLAPTYELTQLTTKAGGVSADFAGSFSLPLQNLVTFVFPFFFGVGENYWGTSHFWEACAYVGILPLIFSSIVLMNKKNKYTLFFSLLLLLSLLLALGNSTPLYALLRLMPGFGYFRAPARFLLLSNFSLAILAGFGFEFLLDIEKEGQRRVVGRVLKLLYWFAGAIGVFIVLASLFLRLEKDYIISFGKNYVKTHVYGKSYHPHSLAHYLHRVDVIYSNLVRSTSFLNPAVYVPFIILLLGIGLIILWQKGKLNATLFKVAVVSIIIFDLFSFACCHRLYAVTEQAFFKRIPKTVEFLQNDKGFYRIYSHASEVSIDLGREQREFIERNIALANLNVIYGLSSFQVNMPFPIKRYLDFYGLIGESLISAQKDPNPRSSFKAVSMANIKYVLTPVPMAADGLKLVYDQEVKVYENMTVLPRAYIVPQAIVVEEEEAILDELKSERFDPRKHVILEERPTKKTDSISSVGSEAKIVNYSPHEVVVKASLTSAGFLALSDTYYPGWKAFVDGRESKIYRANSLFRAVELDQGEHTIRFVFESRSYKVGLIITLLTLMISAMSIFYFLVKRSRPISDV